MFAVGNLLVASEEQVLPPNRQTTKSNLKRPREVTSVPFNKVPRKEKSRDITGGKEKTKETPNQILARLSKRDDYGCPLLMHMVVQNNEQAIREVLDELRQYKKKIVKLLELHRPDGSTILMSAVKYNRMEIIRLFLNAIIAKEDAIKRLLTERYMQTYKQGEGCVDIMFYL